MRRLSSERGIALAVAIFALVVVGGLIAGSFFVATLEQRIGQNTLRQQAAFNVAEAATQEVVLGWNPDVYNTMQLGGTIQANGVGPGGARWSRTVMRMSQNLFVVRTDGFSQDNTSRQRVGALLRLRPLAFDISAALKTQGTLRVGGSSKIKGEDTQPAGWTDCPALQPALPGIQMADTSMLDTQGACADGSCISGDPKVDEDTTINTQSLTTVGDIPFDSLKQFATKIIPGGNPPNVFPSFNGDGTCRIGDLYNWGDPLVPTGACGSHYPIVWVENTVSFQGTYGQGVLIVNGDMKVTGGLTFYGPVIVRGTLATSGTGGHFNGGVIAANVQLEGQTDVLGNAEVLFSSCALFKAINNTATAYEFAERSWTAIY